MAKKNNKKRVEDEDSIKYQCPIVTINAVVEFINSASALGGFSKAMTRDKIGILFGKHPNTFIYTLSAGAQYGLLSNEQYGAGYATTKRFLDITSPIDEHDKTRALYEAMNTPPLYKTIIVRYNGRPLPELNGFMNLFKNEFGFIATTADKGVRTFLENATNLNIIGDNRKLRFIIPDDDVLATKDDDKREIFPNGKEPQYEKTIINIKPPENNMFVLPMQLTGDDNTAELKYPKKISLRDISIIRKYIDGIEERLKAMDEISPFEKVE